MRCGGGYTATLHAEVLRKQGGVWDAQRNDWRKDVNGKRVRAAQPVVVDLMESQIETGALGGRAGAGVPRTASIRKRSPSYSATDEPVRRFWASCACC